MGRDTSKEGDPRVDQPPKQEKHTPEEVRPCATRGDEFRVGQGTPPKGDHRRDGRRGGRYLQRPWP